MSDDDDDKGLTRYESILEEAKERFKRCESWEGEFQSLAKDDLRFVLGDPDNKWQWEEGVARMRQSMGKPTLTINKTKVHCLQIINDIRQNKPSIVVKPTGGKATYEAAETFEGVCRYIEYKSQAKNTYVAGAARMVFTGVGYWRVMTDYQSENTFDQEIYIRPIKNQDNVYLDPDITQPDGSDAEFGFIFEDISEEAFKRAYPDVEDIPSTSTLGDPGTFLGDKMVRVCEYYCKEYEEDELLHVVNPETGESYDALASSLPKEFVKEFRQADGFKSRPVQKVKVRWYKIAGNKIIDEEDWAGKYIPIIRCVGDENIVDGRLERKGHVRGLKDAQRMYNYNSSSSVETVAGQTKTSWMAEARSVEGNRQAWEQANVNTPALLLYSSVDEDGKEIPPPQRLDPPRSSEAYIKGMEIAQQEMMMASGQYQSQFGQNENATSGKAISERQRQGDNATYHFIDGHAIAVRYTARILIDLIPKIFDTERVIKIMAEDGTESDVTIDPSSQEPHKAMPIDDNSGEEKVIFNPSVGTYDVQADIGPDYSTKRQEAFNAFVQIMQSNPELVNIVGDLMFRSADFPMADKLAERLERMVPAQAKGEGLPPDVQQMMQQGQQQIQSLQQTITTLMQQLTEEKTKNRDKRADLQIDAYRAESDRLRDLSNMPPQVPLDQLEGAIRQIMGQMQGENIGKMNGMSGGVQTRPQGVPQRQVPPMMARQMAQPPQRPMPPQMQRPPQFRGQ